MVGHHDVMSLLFVCKAAAVEVHRDVVSLLIAEGADVNYKDADGRSTLYMLTLENQLPMADLLLRHGADVSVRDLEYRSALHVAAWQGHVDIARRLLDGCAE